MATERQREVVLGVLLVILACRWLPRVDVAVRRARVDVQRKRHSAAVCPYGERHRRPPSMCT